MFHRVRLFVIACLAMVLGTASVSAAIADGPRDFDTVTGYSYANDSFPDSDYSYSRTTVHTGSPNTGVKNVYQEYWAFVWHSISTASDMYSGTEAIASQYSPTPSQCRNGRFVGDHYDGSTKRGSTTVNPPLDNCP